MSRKSGKTIALAASLVLAGAAIFSSAASAIPPPRDPACDARVANECTTTWQSLGWSSYQDCVGGQQCLECPPFPGYMCPYPGMYDDYAAEPVAVEPW